LRFVVSDHISSRKLKIIESQGDQEKIYNAAFTPLTAYAYFSDGKNFNRFKIVPRD